MLQSLESSWRSTPTLITDRSEFINDQFKKILSEAIKNEIKCFDFGSIKREVRPHLRTIMAIDKCQHIYLLLLVKKNVMILSK